MNSSSLFNYIRFIVGIILVVLGVNFNFIMFNNTEKIISTNTAAMGRYYERGVVALYTPFYSGMLVLAGVYLLANYRKD